MEGEEGESKNTGTDYLGLDFSGSGHSYDTRYLKSLRRMTMEAFPRELNYKNLEDGQAYTRPTMEDLHESNTRAIPQRYEEEDEDLGNQKGVIKFGWLEGVLMRCLLNIWGVMLFLRLTWVIGHGGSGLGIAIMTLANVVTLVTAISMSAVCTNGQIKAGGIYYMISRSLGPEFGGAIGLMFTISNSIACAMYIVGFCDSLVDLLLFEAEIDDGDPSGLGADNFKRLVGCGTLAFLLLLAWIGMDWVTRTQMGLLVVLIAAQIDFLIGTFMGPQNDEDEARGFIGLNMDLFKENFGPDFVDYEGEEQSFFSVFGVFFPAVTGIVAGANLSGDLKDPASAIPKGTLLAIGLTYVTYVGYGLLVAGSIVRASSGNVTEWKAYNGSDILENPVYDCYAQGGEDACEWGLQFSQQALELASAWGPLIYGGCFAATLSSAIASLVGAPRVFQALAKDELYPGLKMFSIGTGPNNDPLRGYFLCFFVAIGCVLINDLNAIGSLTSNFFLAAYALINFSVFHASYTKSPGWRPAFKYYNAWVSLAGTALCLTVMFTIDWIVALITFAVTLGLYIYVAYRKPEANWGSSAQAQVYLTALRSTLELARTGEHVKNYRPQILVLSGSPGTRPPLVDFANGITKNLALLVCGEVFKGSLKQRQRATMINTANNWMVKHKVKGFYYLADSDRFDDGAKSIINMAGIGKLRPNLAIMGFKTDWTIATMNEVVQYFNVIHEVLDHNLAIGILRLPFSLNFSGKIQEDDVELPEKYQPDDEDAEAATKDKKKKKKMAPEDLYRAPGGGPLSSEIARNVTYFARKQRPGTIDVWWLFDDGGLTILLPYILTQREQWEDCKLRVFTLAASKGELEHEQRSIASLLSRFRIEFTDVVVISDVQKKAKDTTQAEFRAMLEPFMNVEGGTNEAEIQANREKSNRHMRLRELLKEQSRQASFVFITLPMPRKGAVSAPLYMAWLEMLTNDMPPTLVVRGNQEQVITFYS